MAAKMFDWRRPKRTSTESAAQPMAEAMATISTNKGVKGISIRWRFQINRVQAYLQRPALTRRPSLDLRGTLLLS
jgi:ribosomal protein S11